MGGRIPVDWHMHVWLPEHFGGKLHTAAGSSTLGGSPERAREAMQAVDRYIVVGLKTPWVDIPNEFIAEQVQDSGGRAIGLGCVNPADVASAVRELEHATSRLGLRGLKLSPTLQGFDPRDRDVWPIFDAANALGIPVMLHVGAAADMSGKFEFGRPALLDPLLRNFPRLRLIIAHLGQPYMEETVALMRKAEFVFADLSARFHRPWQLYNGLILAQEYNVTGKILFGTDFPVKTPEESVDLFNSLASIATGTNFPSISQETIDSIIYDRPLSLLNLD